MNEIILFLEVIVCFSFVILIKKFLGKEGLYVWIGLSTILIEMQTMKSVNIFGMSTVLGTVLFSSNFLTTDILRECYGEKESKKGVMYNAMGAIAYILFCLFTLFYKSNDIDISKDAFSLIFTITPRITLSSILMMIIANYVDVVFYDYMFKKHNGKKVWLRNNICTMFSNTLENFFFVFFAFYGIYSISDLFDIIITTSIIEIIVAMCDTPFIYIARKIK